MTFSANLFCIWICRLDISGGEFALCICLSKTMLLKISLLIMVRSLLFTSIFLFFLSFSLCRLFLVCDSCFISEPSSAFDALHFLSIRIGLFQVFTWFVAFTLFIKSHFFTIQFESRFFHTTKTCTYTYVSGCGYWIADAIMFILWIVNDKSRIFLPHLTLSSWINGMHRKFTMQFCERSDAEKPI